MPQGPAIFPHGAGGDDDGDGSPPGDDLPTFLDQGPPCYIHMCTAIS